MANNRRRNRRRKSKRTIMRSLQINEMSGVDVPAQEGAVALIMKRAGVDAADTPEAFVNMVQCGDFEGVHATLTSSSGIEHASDAFQTTDTVFIDGSTGVQFSDGLQWSNGTQLFKFENTIEEEITEKLILLTSEEDDHQHAVRLGRFELE